MISQLDETESVRQFLAQLTFPKRKIKKKTRLQCSRHHRPTAGRYEKKKRQQLQLIPGVDPGDAAVQQKNSSPNYSWGGVHFGMSFAVEVAPPGGGGSPRRSQGPFGKSWVLT